MTLSATRALNQVMDMWDDELRRFDAVLDGEDTNSDLSELMALVNAPPSAAESAHLPQLLAEFATFRIEHTQAKRRAARTAVISVAAAATLASGIGLAAAQNFDLGRLNVFAANTSATPQVGQASSIANSSAQPTQRVTASKKSTRECRDLEKMSPAERANALSQPSYAELVEAAQGADKVRRYCGLVLSGSDLGPVLPGDVTPSPDSSDQPTSLPSETMPGDNPPTTDEPSSPPTEPPSEPKESKTPGGGKPTKQNGGQHGNPKH